MTTKNKTIRIVLGIILLGGLLGLFFMSNKNGTNTTENTSASTTVTVEGVKPKTGSTLNLESTAGFYTYANGEYNFSIKYPKEVQSRPLFATFREIGNNWRLYAGAANQGKAIISFSIFNIDQGPYSTGKQTYPLFFTSEVRVGVSPNVKECYTPDVGYTNQKIVNVTINGVTFKKFSTSDAAMMKYVQAESYRTIHNNMCYVIEQIKNGSTYRDEKMTSGISETTLTDYYNKGTAIISTFKFTK